MRRMTPTSRLRAMGAFRGLAAFGTSSGEAPPDIPAGGALYIPSPLYCFSDDAGTVPCAVGDGVAVWKDYYGVAASFTQTTAANRPTLQEAQSRLVVRFDASNDAMTSTLSIPGAETIYCAEIPASNTNSQRTINSSTSNSLIACGRNSSLSYGAFQGGVISQDALPLVLSGQKGWISLYWNGSGAAVVSQYQEGDVSSGGTPGGAWGTVTLANVGTFPEPGKTDVIRLLFYTSDKTADRAQLDAYFNSVIA